MTDGAPFVATEEVSGAVSMVEFREEVSGAVSTEDVSGAVSTGEFWDEVSGAASLGEGAVGAGSGVVAAGLLARGFLVLLLIEVPRLSYPKLTGSSHASGRSSVQRP
ncbi:MAG TPA: hypothetical protein VIV60_22680, partial [Polyangiaceae bacterium]